MRDDIVCGPAPAQRSILGRSEVGLFSVECVIENQQYRTRTVRVSNVLVDTGSELTWINQESLTKIGIGTEKRGRRFVMANGETITRSIGFAILRVGDVVTTDEVVFGEAGDLQLLGARTLEGLNLRVDSRNRKLVAAGPLIAAGIEYLPCQLGTVSRT